MKALKQERSNKDLPPLSSDSFVDPEEEIDEIPLE